MKKKLKSAGRALSLRAKFKSDDLVEVVVMEAVTQTTLAFRIPLNWENSDALTSAIKVESEQQQDSEVDDDD